MIRVTQATTFIVLSFLFCCAATRANGADVPSLLKQIEAYEVGQSRAPLTALSEAVTAATTLEQKAELETQLLTFLNGTSTKAGKSFVTKQLARVATGKSLPLLSTMLRNEETSDMARYALEGIVGDPASKTLREGLAHTSGVQKLGIISSLGLRQDPKAVRLLKDYLLDENEDLAMASISVLGQIASPAAIAALTKAGEATEGERQEAIFDALLSAADYLIDEGHESKAFGTYHIIFDSGAAGFLRSAALRGMVLTRPAESTPTLCQALGSKDEEIRSVAVQLAANIKGPEMTQLLIASIPTLDTDAKTQVISSLGQRGDKSALPAMLALSEGQDRSVRLAALDQLAFLGDQSIVKWLITRASTASGQERISARNSLYRLRGEKVNEEIIAQLKQNPPPAKIEAIKALGKRGVSSSSSVLLKSTGDEDRKVRAEALKVLTEFAQLKDLPPLIQVIIKATEPSDFAGAEKAITALFRRSNNQGLPHLLSTLKEVQGTDAKASLLTVAGSSFSSEAIPALTQALSEPSLELRKAAIRSLAEWDSAEPAELLRNTATTESNQVARILALRGYIRLIGLKSDRTNAQTIKLLRAASGIAERNTEKLSILSLLPKFPCEEGVALALDLKSQAGLEEEANNAIKTIRDSLSTPKVD